MKSLEPSWAWRNVRARGWRGGLSVGLLALAIAANAILFSVADSAVFHRVPYMDAERLVEIQLTERSGRSSGSFLSPALLDEWRGQTDLFSGVEGYLSKTLFLVGASEPDLVSTADITIGFFELLGAQPRWGRGFVAGDESQLALLPVLIADRLARERFGDPASAIGKRLETTGEPLVVVGVMPPDFRFPDGRCRIWRPLDPRGPLARGFEGVSPLARLAPGLSLDTAGRLMEQRSAVIATAAGTSASYTARAVRLEMLLAGNEQRRLFVLLVGAAFCLLLIACANVASLELAAAVQRARTHAIELALGASRASLARVAMLEGIFLMGAAGTLAAVLARLGTATVVNVLPTRLTRSGANPIDFDERTLLFMLAVSAAAWFLSSLPVVAYASRANLLDVLKTEGAAAASSRTAGLLRRLLTVGEVGIAVVLLVGSVAYVRSYQALLALDKGFDTAAVVSISLTIPPQSYSAPGAKRALSQQALDRIRARPGVLAATDSPAPPSMGSFYRVTEIEIDGGAPIEEELTIAQLNVEADYFKVLRIPLIAGRVFEPGEAASNVIVSETIARKFWPGQEAVGHTYRQGARGPALNVIGVVGHVRSDYDPPGAPNTRVLQSYVPSQPPPPPPPKAPATSRPRPTGSHFGFLSLIARVDSRSRVADLQQTLRAIDSGFIVRLDFVDDVYARQFEERLLATRVVGTFGVLAFLIAGAGIYGVMTYLVALRTREIGVRMALGAGRRDIVRLIAGSSLKLALTGTGLGIAGAFVAGRWVQSQLYGVAVMDATAVTAVAFGVVIVALLATWRPARHASRVNPAALLRS